MSDAYTFVSVRCPMSFSQSFPDACHPMKQILAGPRLLAETNQPPPRPAQNKYNLLPPPTTAHYPAAGDDDSGDGEPLPAGVAETAATTATTATGTSSSGIPCGTDPRHFRPSPVPCQPTTKRAVFDRRKVSWSAFDWIRRLSC